MNEEYLDNMATMLVVTATVPNLIRYNNDENLFRQVAEQGKTALVKMGICDAELTAALDDVINDDRDVLRGKLEELERVFSSYAALAQDELYGTSESQLAH